MSVTLVDSGIILLFLVFTVGLGVHFSRTNDSAESFFLGGRGLPGWALGLSLLSTSISSNTFLALPAYTFQGNDYGLFMKDAMLPAVAALGALFVAPFFRREGRAGQWIARQAWGPAPDAPAWSSAFEYLEPRFGVRFRQYAAVCYIAVQLVRLASVLFLISVPVGMFTTLDATTSIVTTGAFVGLYSSLGGVRAVVFTDVLQSIVLLVAGAAAVLLATARVPGGLQTVLTEGWQAGKFSLLPNNGHFEWKARTVYSLMATGMVSHGSSYVSGQDTVQRYLAASSLGEARKAICICAIMSLPTWAFFDFIGVALASFYKHQPDPALQGLAADDVFPHFIVEELPSGLPGLAISGALAAAMSSLDSSLNAISSVVVGDFIKPRVPNRPDDFYLWVARSTTVLTTALVVVLALVFRATPKDAAFELFTAWTSVFSGASLSLFLLAVLVPAADASTAAAGVLFSIVINIYLGLCTADIVVPRCDIDSYWTNGIVNVSFAVAAATWAGVQALLNYFALTRSTRSGDGSFGSKTSYNMVESASMSSEDGFAKGSE